MELFLPDFPPVEYLLIPASMVICTLNYAGLTNVPRIVLVIASATVPLLYKFWDHAWIWYFEGEIERYTAQENWYKARQEEYDRGMEEVDRRLNDAGYNELDDEAKRAVWKLKNDTERNFRARPPWFD
jgi:hypothetical protein